MTTSLLIALLTAIFAGQALSQPAETTASWNSFLDTLIYEYTFKLTAYDTAVATVENGISLDITTARFANSTMLNNEYFQYNFTMEHYKFELLGDSTNGAALNGFHKFLNKGEHAKRETKQTGESAEMSIIYPANVQYEPEATFEFRFGSVKTTKEWPMSFNFYIQFKNKRTYISAQHCKPIGQLKRDTDWYSFRNRDNTFSIATNRRQPKTITTKVRWDSFRSRLPVEPYMNPYTFRLDAYETNPNSPMLNRGVSLQIDQARFRLRNEVPVKGMSFQYEYVFEVMHYDFKMLGDTNNQNSVVLTNFLETPESKRYIDYKRGPARLSMYISADDQPNNAVAKFAFAFSSDPIGSKNQPQIWRILLFDIGVTSHNDGINVKRIKDPSNRSTAGYSNADPNNTFTAGLQGTEPMSLLFSSFTMPITTRGEWKNFFQQLITAIHWGNFQFQVYQDWAGMQGIQLSIIEAQFQSDRTDAGTIRISRFAVSHYYFKAVSKNTPIPLTERPPILCSFDAFMGSAGKVKGGAAALIIREELNQSEEGKKINFELRADDESWCSSWSIHFDKVHDNTTATHINAWRIHSCDGEHSQDGKQLYTNSYHQKDNTLTVKLLS